MVHVVFIAPRFLENTNRYVRAFAELARGGEIALSLVSADPEDAIVDRLVLVVAAREHDAAVRSRVEWGQRVFQLSAAATALDRSARQSTVGHRG